MGARGVITVATLVVTAALVAPAEASPRWTPSPNATVRTAHSSAGAAALTVTPRHGSGRKSVSVRSASSTATVAQAGTAVSVTARLRSSQPGRRLTLRVLEINDGRIVSSRSASVRPRSRGSLPVAVTLRTVRPGSRIQLVAQAKRLRARHTLVVSAVTMTRAGSIPDAPAPRAPAPSTSPAPATSPVPSTPPCSAIDYSDPAQGVRTFTDDFTGTAIDGNHWRVRDNTFLNQDQAWITKDAVTVHDGYLDIQGKRLPESQWRTNPNALYPSENQTRNYSTGYVDTIGRFGQRYGTFEVRAWVPSASTMSRGIWPAFWLRADHQAGEIDPMESYGAPTIRSFDPSSSYEWNSWADTAQGSTNDVDKQKTQGRADVGTDKIWQGWHTYGVTWSPSCLRYTYDGRTVGTVDFDDPATKSYFRGPSFADTFHIRLNMQIGSKYWGWSDPAHTRSEFDFKIDWVHVYQAS